jgi:hypothetical protein
MASRHDIWTVEIQRLRCLSPVAAIKPRMAWSMTEQNLPGLKSAAAEETVAVRSL